MGLCRHAGSHGAGSPRLLSLLEGGDQGMNDRRTAIRPVDNPAFQDERLAFDPFKQHSRMPKLMVAFPNQCESRPADDHRNGLGRGHNFLAQPRRGVFTGKSLMNPVVKLRAKSFGQDDHRHAAQFAKANRMDPS